MEVVVYSVVYMFTDRCKAVLWFCILLHLMSVSVSFSP